MLRKCFTYFLLLLAGLWAGAANAQPETPLPASAPNDSGLHLSSFYQPSPTPNKKRIGLVSGLALGTYSAGMLYLGTLWYAKEELGPFHFFNDAHEWKQMDKMGHALGGFHESRYMIDLYRWAGLPRGKRLLYAGLAGFLAQSSIEVFDGFAKKWGASVPDIGANFAGAALAVGNYWLWEESRIQLKMSYLPSPYLKNPDFQHLFGSNFAEGLAKDYNGQTYWLSVRVHSFLPEGRFKSFYPPWLNLAVGYGANGLEGGYHQDSREVIQAREYRQFYVSFDIDLQQIPTRSAFLKTLFSAVNVIRLPLPALQMDRNGVSLKAFQ
ncbi:MAG: DUF2279 domain-containing protein [Bacteroidetes bacterium]|nr:MAG: DUF2279 domain-containing protein [Bacteroidota bacterium]